MDTDYRKSNPACPFFNRCLISGNYSAKDILFIFLCTVLLLFVIPNPGVCQGKSDSTHRDFSYSFLLVNDNYIGRWLPNENGNYFGADDFLTVSLLSRFYRRDWKYSTTLSAVTSRKFNFRYDLLSFLVSNDKVINNTIIQLGAGFVYKGNLGGQEFQNFFHKMGAVYKVKLPYTKNTGLGGLFHLKFVKQFNPFTVNRDLLNIFIVWRLTTQNVPSRLDSGAGYQFEVFNSFRVELFASFRSYINHIKEYSTFVRDGIISGLNLKYNIFTNWFMDAGFILMPARNIMSDPRYGIFKKHHLPQAWLALGYNNPWKSLLEHLDY